MDLYWLGQSVPMSCSLLFVLPALVCSRGYKRGRGEPIPSLWLKDRLLVVESYGHYVLEASWLARLSPFWGCPASPFIDKGEDTCYTRE